MSSFVAFCEKIDYAGVALAAMLGKFLGTTPNTAEATVSAVAIVAYAAYRGAKLYFGRAKEAAASIAAPVIPSRTSDKMKKDVEELSAKINAVMLRMGFEHK